MYTNSLSGKAVVLLHICNNNYNDYNANYKMIMILVMKIISRATIIVIVVISVFILTAL